MIEENKHIDNLFADKLGGRTFEVPEAFLADLEKRLEAPKVGSSKIRGFWFWLSVIAIAGITTGAYFGMTSNQLDVHLVSAAKTPLVAMNATPMSNQSIFIEVKKTNEESSYVPVEQYNKAPKAYTPNNQKKLSDVKQKALETKRIQDSIAAEVVRMKLLSLSADGNVNGGAGFGSNDETGSDSGSDFNSNPGVNDLASNGETASVDDFNFIPKNSTLYSILTEDDSFGGNNKATTSLQYRDQTINYVDDTLRKVRYILRDSLVIRDSVVTRDSIIFVEKEKEKEKEFDENKNGGNSRFELKAHGGFMNVKSKIESPLQTYSELLTSNETSITSPNFGFALYYYNRNWSIGTGAEYYHFGEEYNFNNVNTSTVFDGVVIDTVITYVDSNGVIWIPNPQIPPFDSITTISMDSTFTTDTTSTNYAGQNVYSRFAIPLNFGYQFNYKDWAFTPRVGLNLEFTTAYRRGIYTNALNEEVLELDHRKFGMSYRLQVEIRRNFDKFHIFVNPYYQNNIGYVIDTPDLKRKYGGFGAQFGVGVRF